MILGSVFERFLEKRPIAVMARATLERLLDPNRIDELFHNTAQEQYESEFLFSSVVALMADVVLQIQPAVHAAYQSGEYNIDVAPRSLYSKLQNVEIGLSEALVRDSAQQAAPVIDALAARLDPWLPPYRCRVIDGCHLAATQHRLEPLRTTWDAPLPGTALAVLDQERMLIDEVFLIEDGHAQERSQLGRVLESVQKRDLWIADRNFCTLGFLFGLADRGAFFTLRQHGNISGELLGKRRRIGRSETGEVYEQWIRISYDGRSKKVRRITVELDEPTRDGDTEIHLLSNLPKSAANAVLLSELYRKRWTLESAFGQISTTLNCEIDTLCYPQAALFAFCVGVLAYNGVGVLEGALRKAHGEEKVQKGISAYYLSLEIRNCLEGMLIAVPPEQWKIFGEVSVQKFAVWLEQAARSIKWSRYQKHPRGPKKKPPDRKPYTNGGHCSTAKLLKKNTA